MSSFVNFLIVKLSLISGFVTHFWVNDSFLGCTVSNIVIFIAMFDNQVIKLAVFYAVFGDVSLITKSLLESI